MYDNNTLTNQWHSVVVRDIEQFDARQYHSSSDTTNVFTVIQLTLRIETFDSDSSIFDVSDRRMV